MSATLTSLVVFQAISLREHGGQNFSKWQSKQAF
jgi:hypothetical protein